MPAKTLLRSSAASIAVMTAFMAFYGVANAQSSTTTSVAATNPSDIGEVIVTAQRRSEKLQDVPIAITNLTATQLQNEQVNGTADIPRLVPNMTTTNNTGVGSANVYFLRGLGQTESFATFDPQVGIYVDDIYIGRASGANFGFYDVDNVEVLRGPQGTLFGRNATGGAIVVNFAKPTEQFGGYVDLEYGQYNRYGEKLAINIPINDQILTKTAAYAVKDDGYVDDVASGNKLNFHDDKGLRESVTLKPAAFSNVVWNISADVAQSKYNAEQDSEINGKRVSYSGFGVASSPVPVIGGANLIADADSLLKESYTDLPNGENYKSWGGMSNLQIKFPSGTLNLISGLRAQDIQSAADFPFPGASGPLVPYDNNPLGQFGIFLNDQTRQYSQEIKFSGSFGDKLTYTTGLFYLYEQNSSSFIESLTLPVGPVTAPSVFALELADEHFKNFTTTEAAYFQGDYKLTDQLSLTLGGRLTGEHKNFKVNPVGSQADEGYDTADVQAAGHKTALQTTQFTPRAVLNYKLTPDILLFTSVTRGFQGGGWNSLSSSAITVTDFKPETIWTYESGFRTESLEHKLIFNADVFYNNVSNYQLITLGPGTGNFVTENAASMFAYGLEMDATYRPIHDWTISGNMGLQQGAYFNPSTNTKAQQLACTTGITADCEQGIVDATGRLADPEDFPHYSFAINTVYTARFQSFDLTPTGGVQFGSTIHVDTSSALAGISHDHATLDLGLKFQMHDQPWYIMAKCQNCTYTSYESQLLFIKYYNTPGYWGLEGRYNF